MLQWNEVQADVVRASGFEADRLIRTSRYFNKSDRDDIIQELQLAVWRKLDKYNDAWAPSTFINMLMRREGLTMLRKRSAQKRDSIRTAKLCEAGQAERCGRAIERRCPKDAFGLVADTRTMLSMLPRHLKERCERILAENSRPPRLSAMTERTRREFADLRRAFQDAGMRMYLDPRADDGSAEASIPISSSSVPMHRSA